MNSWLQAAVSGIIVGIVSIATIQANINSIDARLSRVENNLWNFITGNKGVADHDSKPLKRT